MKPNRRGFLGMMAATPAIARKTATDLAHRLSPPQRIGQAIAATGEHGMLRAGQRIGGGSPGRQRRVSALQLILRDPAKRQALMDQLWKQCRSVEIIDPDIDAMRSFSMNAKITFQRQRNVQRQLEFMLRDENPWDAVETMINNALSDLFPFGNQVDNDSNVY